MTTELSQIWNRPVLEQTITKPRPSPPHPSSGEERRPSSRTNGVAPRAYSPSQPPLDLSGSPRSSISSSISATSSASPSHPSVSLPPGIFLDSTGANAKPRPTLQSTPSFGLYPEAGGGAVFSGLAFLAGREKDFGVQSFAPSQPLSSAVTPTPPSIPPATRSSPKSEAPDPEHTQNALAEIFAGNPRPHLRSSVSSHPSPLSATSNALASPRIDSPSDASTRSYFSPPPPGSSSPSHHHSSRVRSHSSASVLDHHPYASGMTGPASNYGNGASGYSSRSPSQQPPADLHGFRPSSSNPHHYSSSMPATIPKPIRIGASPREDGSPSGRMGMFGSYSGTGFHQGSAYDQTGWRNSAQPRQSSFGGGWDEYDREGRSRMRADEERSWGDRESSASSAGTGIGLSNMSPFTRDGSRTLADFAEGGHRSRRDYGLGAVGSGRKRGESVWGSSRPLREAEDEDADDAFAPPTKSGATSRRHSFAAFNPPSRSQIGFALPDDKSTDLGNTSATTATSGSTPFGGARGSSAINDDDLAADLNSLHLDLEAHAAATDAAGIATSSPFQPPPDFNRSTSPPTIPLSSARLQSSAPASAGPNGASRFFQAPSANGSRATSRFEFGGVGSSGEFQPPPPNGMVYGGSFTQQRMPPSFGVGPPSPPNSFYSAPLSPHGLSAQSPAFHGFNSAGPGNGKPSQFVAPGPSQPADSSNLGRGIPLHSVPSNAPLYIVEFKAGRKDLFFVEEPNLQLRQGDLVIVEADRGKDIGKFYKPCSLDEVQAFQQRLVEMALGQLAHPTNGAPPNPAAIQRMTKEFSPKKIFGKAQPVDTQLLLSKAQDEVKALALVRSKVVQKALSMEVLDAEWQFDRRKLTFYYIATERVDFRELVRELFRLYKTRIWMCCLDGRVQLE